MPLIFKKDMIYLKITDRQQRGFVSFLFIGITLIFWVFFNRIYPLIIKQTKIVQLPEVESNIFLFIFTLILILIVINWSIRNKLWFGPAFSFNHYSMIRQIRKQIKDARFEDENELNKSVTKLPRIKVLFDNNKTRISGQIHIKNSIKFDKKLENIRIDAALNGYLSERKYLSKDRNWYVYEFYSINSQNQIEITSEKNLIKWTNKTTNNYELRLDERTTVSLHHLGLAGQTGSGKSFFIQMLCEQILSKKINHELFIIDPKRTDLYQMGKRSIKKEQTADKRNAIELINNFHEHFEKRRDELEVYFSLLSNRNKTYENAVLPALILLIDEFGSLKESWKTLPKKERDEVESKLAEITFEGRQLGCFMWIATQQMNAQTIPTSIREQLVIKIVLGDSDEQTYRTLFSSSIDIPDLQFSAGQGLYSAPGLASINNPRLLSVPFCSFLIGNT